MDDENLHGTVPPLRGSQLQPLFGGNPRVDGMRPLPPSSPHTSEWRGSADSRTPWDKSGGKSFHDPLTSHKGGCIHAGK